MLRINWPALFSVTQALKLDVVSSKVLIRANTSSLLDSWLVKLPLLIYDIFTRF